MEVPEALGIDPEDAPDVREHFTEDTFDGRTYWYLSDARHGIERGTVIIDGTVIRGFPSIPRVLVLKTGVPEYFDRPIAVTEKLNGYNVRIAAVGEPLAFTRGGFVCPFSTAVAREVLDLDAFFRDHPDRMLCTEFIGPENPYTAHEYPDVDSVEPRVFDICDRETGTSIPVERRREIASSHGFPQPELFEIVEPGEAPARIESIIDDLDQRGREGVVMQSVDGSDRLKYTTGHQHQQDLAYAFSLPFDYGRDFLFSRLIREGFQAVEFEERGNELDRRAEQLGKAILKPMVETIRQVQSGETVGERHTVRGHPDTIESLLEHFDRQNVTVSVEADRTVDGDRVVEFVKVSDSTRDSIQHFLDGGTIDE